MITLDQMAETGHERVLFRQDPSGGLQAIVAIYSTARGPAFGTVRRRIDDIQHTTLRVSRAAESTSSTHAAAVAPASRRIARTDRISASTG